MRIINKIQWRSVLRKVSQRFDSRKMSDYPLTVYTSTLKEDIVQCTQRVADLAYKYQWINLIKKLKDNEDLINSSRLPVDANTPPKLYTPLHQAAFGKAPQNVFEELLKLGASKTLKTADGQTAYDIAKSKGLDEKVLKLIEIPEEIAKKESVIKKMEEGLHKVILGRVEKLIKENGQQLPQLSFLYEFGNFWYPVPGMYGGFSVCKLDDEEHSDDGAQKLDDSETSDKSDDNSHENNQQSIKGEKTSECVPESDSSNEQPNKGVKSSEGGVNLKEGVVVESWCRIAGGSGQRHEIDEEGNVKLVDTGFV